MAEHDDTRDDADAEAPEGGAPVDAIADDSGDYDDAEAGPSGETINADDYVEELNAEVAAAVEASSVPPGSVPPGSVPPGAEHQMSMPPPLPPKKLGRIAIIGIIVVAVIAAVLAVVLTEAVFTTPQPEVATPEPEPMEEPLEEEPATISLDTVVIGADDDVGSEGEGDDDEAGE